MLIRIIVKTHQKKSSLERIEAETNTLFELEIKPLPLFEAKVKAEPINNKANLEIIDLLAKHFQTDKKQIKLKSGAKSKIKVFEINL